MTISILIPFKNAARHIKDCLISIQKQTEQDWHIIAVDDHSGDQSLKIVQDLAKTEKRITLLKNQGHGIIPGLRTAFAHAKGDLITRMDADDLMTNDKLAELKIPLLKNGPGHVSTGLVKYFSDTELGPGYLKYENWLNTIHREGRGYQEIYKECVIPSPCWMVWRQDLEAVGAFDSEAYPEDYDLCFRFYKAGLKIMPSQKVIHHWRDYATRTSRTDPRLKDQSFMSLKLNWFLELEVSSKNQLALWGAGNKGKHIAKLLVQQGLNFEWVCTNPKKIGHNIYNHILKAPQILKTLDKPKIIVAVAQRNAQSDIQRELEQQGFHFNSDYFLFS